MTRRKETKTAEEHAPDHLSADSVLFLAGEALRDKPDRWNGSYAHAGRRIIVLTEEDAKGLDMDAVAWREAKEAGRERGLFVSLGTFACIVRNALARRDFDLEVDPDLLDGQGSEYETRIAALGRARVLHQDVDSAYVSAVAAGKQDFWIRVAVLKRALDTAAREAEAARKHPAQPERQAEAGQKAETPDEMNFAEIVEKYDVLKSSLCKAVNKAKGDPRYLPAAMCNGKWYVHRRDLEVWLRGHDARREEYKLRHPNGARASVSSLAHKLKK